MCGIGGLVGYSKIGVPVTEVAASMMSAMEHRGPDGSGVWLHPSLDVMFCHRRLSIIETSAAGAQPIASRCGRYVMAFNGEIYNHLTLRRELSVAWRGGSDSETLIELISRFGIVSALTKVAGMFAIAVWDTLDEVLYLARDRLGQKPLYYGYVNGVFSFSSQLSSLVSIPGFHPTINDDAVPMYMRYGCVLAPASIYKGVSKLPVASLFSIGIRDVNRGGEGRIESFWSLADVALSGTRQQFSGGEQEIAENLEALMMQVVGEHMISDVPLGAFLSGGIDSSLVTLMMQRQRQSTVRTFSIGFESAQHDEAPIAREVARRLGTDHTEFYVSESDALDVIPRLPDVYDEPFSDSSQIPTLLLAGLAKQKVSVALSGDGGDEVFGGYNRYLWVDKLWRTIGLIPFALRKRMASGQTMFGERLIERSFSLASKVVPSLSEQRNAVLKIQKILSFVDSASKEEVYSRLVSDGPGVRAVRNAAGYVEVPALDERFDSFQQKMMVADSLWYLPDDVMVKVDRATMAVSLESRAPLMDHRLIEFAWRIPMAYKISNQKGKRILLSILDRHLGAGLVDRPKMGFAVPLSGWLRGELRDWVHAELDSTRLRESGFFCEEYVERLIADHMSGRRDHSRSLWSILMFNAWLARTSGAQ